MAAAGAAFVLVAGTGSASAHTVDGTTQSSCITLRKVDSHEVYLTNNCVWTEDVKVVWRLAVDSNRVELSPGERRRFYSMGFYDGWKYC
ncbi:MAG: hypothetical protein K0R62_3639 [Nonomuraea muscovyensis]|nr:hypothetical protein [Nonomuraea muscovyensis]